MTSTVEQNTTTVAPPIYDEDVEYDIQVSKAITTNTKSHIKCNAKEDRDLKTLRAFLLDSNNQQLHEYFRDVRELIVLLREKFLEIDNEIKSTTRYQHKLEKCLDNLRKDTAISNACNKLRENRPAREIAFGQDQIDHLLADERIRQQYLKEKLQDILATTIAQVNELIDTKAQLQIVIEERERVLNLINISGVNVDFRKALKKKRAIVVEGKEEFSETIDQLCCYTTEADESLNLAKHVKILAKNLRKKIREIIENTNEEQKSIHRKINNCLKQKTFETRQIKAKLTKQIGENRLQYHKATRAMNNAQKSYDFIRGPVMSGDLTTREKADRFIVQSFERHFPNSVSQHEKNQLEMAEKSLKKSITQSENNIKLLMAAHNKLSQQLNHKMKSETNEANVARFRRSKANHRWVIDSGK